METQKIRYIS